MNSRHLTRVALLTALTAAGAFVRLPLGPVSFTLQTFFVILAGIVLGPGLGALSQAVYLILGLAGVPILAGGGGLGYVFQPSFGYLVGFIAGAAVAGWVAGSGKTRLGTGKALLAGLAGFITVYAFGVPYLRFALAHFAGKDLTWALTLKSGFLIFLPGDLVKLAVAAGIAPRLRLASRES